MQRYRTVHLEQIEHPRVFADTLGTVIAKIARIVFSMWKPYLSQSNSFHGC